MKMNEKLKLFNDMVSYKVWLVQFPLVCDVINLIKQLLYYHGTRRIIKPLSVEEIGQDKFHINDEGIVFYRKWGIYNMNKHYKINTVRDDLKALLYFAVEI